MKKLIIITTVLLAFSALTFAQKPSTYRVLGADKKHVVIVGSDGKIEWEMPNPEAREIHDIQYLPNGNVLYQTGYTTVMEVNKDKQIVWKYESKLIPENTKRVEIHSFQRLKNGLTMISESGNGRIIEVDKDGKIVNEIKLKLANPNPHRDTRMVRKTDKGNYLVCQEGEGKVIEYDKTGKIVWQYVMELGGRPRSDGHGPEGHGNEVFGAIRLKNGNTMIAGGNNNRVLEVNKDGKIVWSIDQKELPGITLAWVTTLIQLPNGNLIVGNTHANKENPQMFEVTRDKKVVWQFNNWEIFGNNLVAATVINLKGKIIH